MLVLDGINITTVFTSGCWLKSKHFFINFGLSILLYGGLHHIVRWPLGDIAHSCYHGPPPHSIKIVIVKKDNAPKIFKKIVEIAGPKPETYRAKPYYIKTDVKKICDALINGREHPAIEIKNHKVHGNIFVIKPKNITELIEDGTVNTIRARAKKVKLNVAAIISEYNNFIEMQYGYWIAYKKK